MSHYSVDARPGLARRLGAALALGQMPRRHWYVYHTVSARFDLYAEDAF